jgi:ATP-dependent RNA helicase DeaD
VLNALAGENSLRNLLLAAIKLVHEAGGAVLDEIEIPDASHRPKVERSKVSGKSDPKSREGLSRDNKSKGGPRRSGGGNGTGFVYIGLGRKAGIQPGDLVGVIANQAGLKGGEIGPIKITDNYSIVGVPEESVDRVIAQIGSGNLRGKRMKVRRYVD